MDSAWAAEGKGVRQRGQENILVEPEGSEEKGRMPRQARIEFEGATYHVMCRGDRREDIYEDDADREMFLATLAQAIKRAGWRLHGYVLMSNHYHLLVETPKGNLVRGMTWLQTTYTTRYNARHRKRGHVFGGRYKAILVDSEEASYFVALLNYVHLNPARAGLVATGDKPRLVEYRWSSLPAYVTGRGRPGWLTLEWGFSCLGCKDSPGGRKKYLKELEARIEQGSAGQSDEGIVKNLQSTLSRGWYFGREAFRDWLLAQSEAVLARHKSSGQNYHGPEMSDHHLQRARQILDVSLQEAETDISSLKQRSKSDPLKVEIAMAIRQETMVPLRWIADELQMGSAVNVSRLTAAILK